MSNKTMIKNLIALKAGVLTLLLSTCFAINVQAAEVEATAKTQADKDWENMLEEWNTFPGTPGEKKAYAERTVSAFEAFRFRDRTWRNNIRLAAEFWDKYPQDKRHNNVALYQFFSMFTIPSFYATELPDELEKYFSAMPSKKFYQHMREVPIDLQARDRWLEKGNAMVASVLNSDASAELKAAAAIRLISRDVRWARDLYTSLSRMLLLKERREKEQGYWHAFEMNYFQSILQRLDAHVVKYAELEVVANHVQSILHFIEVMGHPLVAESYWRHYLQMTGSDHPLAHTPGAKALQKIATKKLDTFAKRWGAKPVLSGLKAVDMEFTALDGAAVSLSKMRGKVVLVEFWATWCKPCVAGLPHLKKLYNKYQKHGFEIIGVNVDEESAKKQVLKVLEENEVTWPQRFEGKGLGADTYSRLYGIEGLPIIWLLDKEGKIVYQNASGRQPLEPLLRKYLGLDK